MTDKEVIIDEINLKECLFYIDYNPPECSGTWGGAIHKGACKVNSIDCKDTDECFIKNLYNKLKIKEQECEKLKKQLNQAMYLTEGTLRLYAERKNIKYKKAIDEIEDIADDHNRVEKTSQYYRDGFDQIQDIINNVKEQ